MDFYPEMVLIEKERNELLLISFAKRIKKLLGTRSRESQLKHLENKKVNSSELVFISQNFAQASLAHFVA